MSDTKSAVETEPAEPAEPGEVSNPDAPARRSGGTDTLEREGDAAADYLEGLLEIADIDYDIEIGVEGTRAMVWVNEVDSGELEALVGRDGRVLDALQELTRLAATREIGERSRLMLDVAGYRADQRARLVEMANEAVAEAQRTAAPVRLDPMTPFERKVVHDAVAAAGLVSESEGEEPTRRVIVRVS